MVFLNKKVKASNFSDFDRFLQFDGRFFPHPAMEQLSPLHQPSAVQNMCSLKLQKKAARNPHTMKNWAISTKTVELQGSHKIFWFCADIYEKSLNFNSMQWVEHHVIFLASNCHSGQTTQKIHLAKFVPPPVRLRR